jgi:voltage-gated potassium channel
LKGFYRSNKRLALSLTVLVCVLLLGTIGFLILEETVNNLFDSFYMTLVTMTTVDYGDYVPTNNASRIVASFVMVGGIAAGVTALQSLFDVAVSRSIREELGLPPRRVRMNDHYIICGYGNVGMEIISQLREKGEKYVIIEKDPAKVEELVEAKIPVIKGDATSDGVLGKAGISQAQGVFATADDSTNVVIVVTAKMLNPDIVVVSEVKDPTNAAKISKVGADTVINCHEMGAKVMVKEARRIVLCPVCGVEVDPDDCRYTADYEGKTYYLCGIECYEAFLKNPKRFVDIKRTVDSTGD